VRFLAVAVLALATVPATPRASAGPRKGRIVRVERPRTGARGLPRVCRLSDPSAGMCWGRPPIKGETAWVIGPESNGHPGNRGQIMIGEVTETQDSCSMPKYWTFALEPMQADLADLESWQTWVLVDLEVGPHARTVEPSAARSPDDKNSPWLAIDRGNGEGDGEADFVVTAFQCDGSGSQINGGATNGYCLDYWIRGGGRWSQARRDVVVPEANCRP